MAIQSFHLIIVGFDEIVGNKYITCIEEAKREGHLLSYSIVDLESRREDLNERILELGYKPLYVHYLSDQSRQDTCVGLGEFEQFITNLRRRYGTLKMYIATEVKAHERYLRYCVENGIPSLVEKPVLAPLLDGRFAPAAITEAMNALVSRSASDRTEHSVMTLSRYHEVYNRRFIEPLEKRIVEWRAPLTSLHLRAAGGVWNRHVEYEEREDHPYKYGYGMMMHGAYHYVDLAAQLLSLNAPFFENSGATLTLSTYAAFPRDQHKRVPLSFAEKLQDQAASVALEGENWGRFGETDIVSSFVVRDIFTNRIVTLGTLSFEQTTPSIRHWTEFPPGLYNKNGRTSLVDVEAQLSTLHSANIRVFDVPIESGTADVDRIDAFARIETRTNASLLRGEKYNHSETYSGLFHSDSNRALMRAWLSGGEHLSTLADHVLPMRIVQAICESMLKQGAPLTMTLF